MKRASLLVTLLVTVLAALALTLRVAESSASAVQHRSPVPTPVNALDDDHGAASEHGEGASATAGHADEPNPIPGPAAGLITALTTLLVFAGLVAILGKYAWGPIVAGLKAREDKIRADIDAAERARAGADASRRQYESQIAGAESRVRDLIAQAQADGQQLAARIRTQAQEEAEEIKGRAMREIEQSRREAVEQIRAEAATLATSIAEKILRREVNRDDQRRLIEDSLDELETVGSGV